jgi:hypothetical protein
MRVNITYVTKTKKERHKENGTHLRFRPTYCIIAKIFTTAVSLDTLDVIPEKSHKIYHRMETGSALHKIAPRDVIR